jgi:hypothetical protein
MAGAGSQLESHFPEAQQIDLTVVRDDTAPFAARPERFRPPFPLFKLCGAKGNRTTATQVTARAFACHL